MARRRDFSVPSLTSRRIASWLLWSSLAIHVPIAVVAIGKSRLPHADLDNYYDIGTRSGRPYVDFPVEFPVATAQTFRTLAPIAGNRERFGVSLVLLSVAADVAIAGALGWGWGIEAAACYAFIVIPLIDLFFLRMDLWPTALATIAAAAWRRERWRARRNRVRGRRRVQAVAADVSPPAARVVWRASTNRTARDSDRGRTDGSGGLAMGRRAVRPLSGLDLPRCTRLGGRKHRRRGVDALRSELDAARVRRLANWNDERSDLHPAFCCGSHPMPVDDLARRADRPSGRRLGRRNQRAALHVGAPVPAVLGLAGAGQRRCVGREGSTDFAVLTGIAVFLTNLAFKSFVPLLHGAPSALTIVLARNLLLAVLAVDAVRLLRRAADD